MQTTIMQHAWQRLLVAVFAAGCLALQRCRAAFPEVLERPPHVVTPSWQAPAQPRQPTGAQIDVFFSILSSSDPAHAARRQAIRSTWLAAMRAAFNGSMAHVFLLSSEGKEALAGEQQEQQDLLFVDVKQEYHNQIELIFAGMEYAIRTYQFHFL